MIWIEEADLGLRFKDKVHVFYLNDLGLFGLFVKDAIIQCSIVHIRYKISPSPFGKEMDEN